MKKTCLLVSLVFLLVVTAEGLSFELTSGKVSKVQIQDQRKVARLKPIAKARSKSRPSPQANPFAGLVGTWTNQLGSTLSIAAVDANTGQITGTYKSPSGGGPNEYALIGWANTKPSVQDKDNVTVVSFSVRWGAIGSIATWAGYVRTVNNVTTITANWFLVRPNSDFLWDHILTNQDVFKKN
jgi:hypothetical protein